MLMNKLAVLALITVAGCGKQIDAGKTEASIVDGLAKKGLAGAKASCPSGRAAKAGDTFTCTVTDGAGATHVVNVTQKDANGSIEWKLDGLILDTKVVVADAKAKLAGANITCPHDAMIVKQTDTIACKVDENGASKQLTIKISDGNVAWEVN
jgi:hypothetical protein